MHELFSSLVRVVILGTIFNLHSILIYFYMGVDTGGGGFGAEATPDFQAIQYIQYTCMETNS